MSYTTIEMTILSNADAQLLGDDVANWLVEKIPELTLMYRNDVAYANDSYLAFDGKPYGFRVQGYYYNSYGSISKYVGLSPATNITASAAGTALNGFNCNADTSTVNGSSVYQVRVGVIKTSEGYIVTLANNATAESYYIGYYTTELRGKAFVQVRLADLYVTMYGSSSSSPNSSTSFMHFDDDGSYVRIVLISVGTDLTNAPTGSAILTPVYTLAQSVWVEPFCLSDVYVMCASSLPDLYVETRVGNVNAVFVGGKIVVV